MIHTLICLFLACQLGAHQEPEEFCWTKEKTEFANIQVQVAGPGVIQDCIQVSGKVIIHPDHLAYVIPKVAGSVYEVKKNLGEHVEQGEVLALIESTEIAERKAAYKTALKKSQLQQKLWGKEKLLQGISPLQDYLNAELAVMEAEIEVQLASQNLHTLGFDAQEINKIAQEDASKLRFFSLKAPLKGRVLERNLTLGEAIDSSTKAFVIGNFDRLWVEIDIPQSDLHHLKEGLKVELAAMQGRAGSAQICQFSPRISEETRRATAIAVIDTPSDMPWSPGEFVTATIQTNSTPVAVIVPLAAIQMIKGEKCIFVESGQEFIPHAVKLGKHDQNNVEILSGLDAGTNYAACNTFCLKADFEKEEGEHH